MSAISKLTTLASTHPKKTAAVAVAALVLIGGTGAGAAYMAHHVTTPQEHLAATQDNQAEETLVLLKATGQGMDKALTRAQIAVFDSNHKCVVSSAEYEPEVFYDLGKLGKGTYFIVLKSLPVLEDGTLYVPKNMPPTFTIDSTDKPVSVLLELVPVAPENMSKEQLLQAASELKLAGKQDVAEKLVSQAEHAESRPETDMARLMNEVTKGADTTQGSKLHAPQAASDDTVRMTGDPIKVKIINSEPPAAGWGFKDEEEAKRLIAQAEENWKREAEKSQGKTDQATQGSQSNNQAQPSNQAQPTQANNQAKPKQERKRWVVDKPAYDEQVEDGEQCVFSDGHICYTPEEAIAYMKAKSLENPDANIAYSIQAKYKTIHHEEQGHWETYYE